MLREAPGDLSFAGSLAHSLDLKDPQGPGFALGCRPICCCLSALLLAGPQRRAAPLARLLARSLAGLSDCLSASPF